MVPNQLSSKPLKDHTCVVSNSKVWKRVGIAMKTGCRPQGPVTATARWQVRHPESHPAPILTETGTLMHFGRTWHLGVVGSAG